MTSIPFHLFPSIQGGAPLEKALKTARKLNLLTAQEVLIKFSDLVPGIGRSYGTEIVHET